MRVFVTGATGFIGSAIVRELIGAGHQVLGLARSDAAAKSLIAGGAQVHRGDLGDLENLRSGAATSDAVIHAGFIHDFSNYAAAAETDQRAIETLGAVLANSDRPLHRHFRDFAGSSARDHSRLKMIRPIPTSPRKSEQAVLAIASRGVRVSILRLPPSVHGEGDHGFVPALIGIAREKGVSAYVGDGFNRWPAVHRLDAARLYRLVLEKGSAGTTYHGVADEGIPVRNIAEVIGRRLNVPVVSKSQEDAAGHFGWIAHFFTLDGPASSAQTREKLQWRPVQPGLIADLDSDHYFNPEKTAAA